MNLYMSMGRNGLADPESLTAEEGVGGVRGLGSGVN